MKRLFRHPRVRDGLIHLSAWYLDVTLRSKRWSVEGDEAIAFLRTGQPAILAFWHEALPLMPGLVQWYRGRSYGAAENVHFLVSRHNDGRFVGAVMSRFRLQPVFGSSSRGGPAALQTMVRLLRDGQYIGITPDGPRGPRRQPASGVAQLAALARVPIIPCGGATTHGRRLSTWDRMVLPLPLGRGAISCGAPIHVPREGWQDALPVVTDALNAAMHRAERLCGG